MTIRGSLPYQEVCVPFFQIFLGSAHAFSQSYSWPEAEAAAQPLTSNRLNLKSLHSQTNEGSQSCSQDCWEPSQEIN